MRHTKRFLHSRRGVTLIETLIATVVVSLVILGSGAIFYKSVNVQRDSERYSFANNLARQKIEATKNLPFSSIPVGTTTANSADGQFSISTTITNDVDSLGRPKRTKTITVVVSELTGGQNVLATHTTTIYQRGL